MSPRQEKEGPYVLKAREGGTLCPQGKKRRASAPYANCTLIRIFSVGLHILWNPLILQADMKGPSQTARMRKLVWAFTVSINICSNRAFVYHTVHQKRNNLKKTGSRSDLIENCPASILYKSIADNGPLWIYVECLLSERAGLGGSVGCAVRLETRRSRVQPPPRSATFFRGD